MNKEKVSGIIRHILTAGGGYIVGKGYMDESTMMEIVGTLSALGGTLWSVLAKKPAPVPPTPTP